MENETWIDVYGYEGHYKVSSLGRVKSLKGKCIILSQSCLNDYCNVGLSIEGKSKTWNVHSLMGLSFIDKDYLKKKLVVDHINGNKKDNRLVNLRITTHRENVSGTKKSNSKYTGVHWCNSKNKYIAIIQRDKKSIYLGSFKSELAAKKEYQKALSKIKNNIDIIPNTKPTSSVKWVYFHSKSNRWRVQIKGKYHGSFKTENEAINKLKNIKNEKKTKRVAL